MEQRVQMQDLKANSMIDSITIRNDKSILDLTLDMTYAEGKAPNGWLISSNH